jgi:hypothetical protein
MKARGKVKKDLKTNTTAMPGPMTTFGPVEIQFQHAENPDKFVSVGLDCFNLVGFALVVATFGALAMDGPALAPVLGIDDIAEMTFVEAGLALFLIAFVALASIQVRYTFEHAGIYREHYYALKLARRREAAAALRSLAVCDAVPAVEKLIELRVETAILDRDLAIWTVKLGRRWRDLTVFPCLVTAAGFAAALAQQSPGSVLAAIGAASWLGMFFWARDRVRHVREVLDVAPADLSALFNPTPPLKETVQSLLNRINSHFDRLNGVPPARDAGTEEEEGGF